MALTQPIRLVVDDASGVAPVRRAAERMADILSIDALTRGQVAIVATELATNLVRHAGGGEVVIRPGAESAPALDLIAWDRGPGIRDIGRATADGFSTASGAGTGLGAIGRQARSVDIHSAPGRGTVVTARLGAEDAPSAVDGLALALAGEEANGDAWSHVRAGDLLTVMLADGLGHGPQAAEASNAATRVLRTGAAPAELLERMHGALRPTRGAAIAIAQINLATGRLRFAGLGNVSGSLVSGAESRSLASMNGTVGHRVTRIREYEEDVPPGALLILHSDGCRNGWRLPDYPGLARRSPLVVAATLIRDFERGKDDVSVVVAQAREAS